MLHEWNCHLGIGNSSQYLILRKDNLQKTVVDQDNQGQM